MSDAVTENTPPKPDPAAAASANIDAFKPDPDQPDNSKPKDTNPDALKPDPEQPQSAKADAPKSAADTPASASGTVTKAVRRSGVRPGSARKGTNNESPPVSAPKKPDMAKTIAIAVCGVLFAACVVVGIYVFFLKPKPPSKVAVLSPAAQALADKAVKAEKLYKEGLEKSASVSLEELGTAEKDLVEAMDLFNDVADQYKTVPGYEDKIRLAHDKKLSIDPELKKVRDKIFNLENEERIRKSKATQADKPAEPEQAAAVEAASKEPTEEQLSDKNLDRLFDADPSEYERLAKIREKKDPNFKMKKP